MKFYLDYDTRLNKYFIAPLLQDKNSSYLIIFTARFKAEAFMKALLTGKEKSPTEKVENFDLIEVISNGNSKINIFAPKAVS